MPGHILGISAFYHDSAAAIVADGIPVAAAQEERFSRRKNDPDFPKQAIEYCLGAADTEADKLAAIVFYDDPSLSLDRSLSTLLAKPTPSRSLWRDFACEFLAKKIFPARAVRHHVSRTVPLYFARHHLSHAASAFYPSPFQEAAVLTIDGVGEWDTTSISTGREAEIEMRETIRFPHSLGLLYSAFTSFCGFRVNNGEYKLMGLAPYGQPRYAETILNELIAIDPNGSFRLNLEHFGFLDSDGMTNKSFEDLFGGPPLQPGAQITAREADLAASVQLVTEQAILRLARHARELTGMNNLCLAGGVALNCVANGLITRESGFDQIWIQPAAGDAGGALGAALLGAHQLMGTARIPGLGDNQAGSLLGPGCNVDQLEERLVEGGHAFDRIDDPETRYETAAEYLADGRIVALCSGRMEFGPRALGSRSILADPRRSDMQSRLNLKVKFRESFRPFAPAVLNDWCGDYFSLEGESPYMLLTAPVRDHLRQDSPTKTNRRSSSGKDEIDLVAWVNEVRSVLPAVTHVDFSARVQTVDDRSNPDFRRIIEQFHELTGCPVIVNTSFNGNEEPIVCTPLDAWSCFCSSDIDVLIVENLVITGKATPPLREPLAELCGTAAKSMESNTLSRVELFFDSVLVPAAKRLHPIFASHLDDGRPGYKPAEQPSALIELESLDDIRDALHQHWSAAGTLDSTLGLLGQLFELIEELTNSTNNTEISPVTPHKYTLF